MRKVYSRCDVITAGKSLQAANMAEKSGGRMGKEMRSQDDSSDSENEAEPAKSFHRRMSTNREIKTTVSDSKLCFARDSKKHSRLVHDFNSGKEGFPNIQSFQSFQSFQSCVLSSQFHQCL